MGDEQMEVIRKGSEIKVDGNVFISVNQVARNPLYTTDGLDDLVKSGKVRAFQAHGKVYYSKDDLDKAFPIGFVQPE